MDIPLETEFGPISFDLIGKYIFSIIMEVCLIGLVLFGLDIVLSAVSSGFATTSAAVGTSKAAVKAQLLQRRKAAIYRQNSKRLFVLLLRFPGVEIENVLHLRRVPSKNCN